MRQVRSLLVSFAVLLAIGGPAAQAGPPVRVVTTTTDLAEVARLVGGDRVEVSSLAKGYQNPHFIEPRPSDVIKVSKARVFVEMGLDLEIWADGLLDAAHNRSLERVDCSQDVAVLEKTDRAGPQHGDVHPRGNPHYHLDPANWPIMAGTIAGALARADPPGAASYRRNLAAFEERASGAVARWESKMAPFRGSRVIDYHRTWTYFAHRYGLGIVGYIEAKPGIPPSPAHLEAVMDLAKKQRVQAIFQETWLDRRLPDMVARASGTRVVVLPSSIGAMPGTGGFEPFFDRIVALVARTLAP